MPASTSLAYLAGAVEISVGASVLIGTRYGVVALTLMYGVFTVLAGVQASGRLGTRSCGCFGDSTVPATPFHVLFNATAALFGAYLLLEDRLLGLNDLDVALIAPAIVLLTGSSYLAFLVLAELPKLAATDERHADTRRFALVGRPLA
jgi:hypothetical protein